MNRRLLDHLIKLGIVDALQLRSAVAHQRKDGGELIDIMLEQRMVTDIDIARGYSSYYRYQSVDISVVRPSHDVLSRVTGEFCRRHVILPFATDRDTGDLLVAVADPARSLSSLDAVQVNLGMKIRPYVAPRRQLIEAIESAYERGRSSMSTSRLAGTEVYSMSHVPGLALIEEVKRQGREPTGTLSSMGGRVPSMSQSKQPAAAAQPSQGEDTGNHVESFFSELADSPRTRRAKRTREARPNGALPSQSGAQPLGARASTRTRGGTSSPGGERSRGNDASRLTPKTSAGTSSGSSRSSQQRGRSQPGRSAGPEASGGHSGASIRSMRVASDASVVSEELARLKRENQGLRTRIQRLEASLQLEITLIRQLMDLLLEQGVLDQKAYQEKMSRLL